MDGKLDKKEGRTDMDIRQLNYFMAVAHAGSFSKAAENLAVSQPTLSVTVKKLEEELGVQLFYSFNREQRLTDEGLRLMNGARRLLDVYQQTVEGVRVMDRNTEGAFTLGLSPLFGACFSETCCRALRRPIPISALRSWRTAPTASMKRWPGEKWTWG